MNGTMNLTVVVTVAALVETPLLLQGIIVYIAGLIPLVFFHTAVLQALLVEANAGEIGFIGSQ